MSWTTLEPETELPSRRAPGPRQTRRAEQRRRRRRLLLKASVPAVAFALLATVAATLWIGQRGDDAAAPQTAPPAPAPEQDTLLLVVHPAERAPATTVTLLVSGPADDRGAVIFLPVGTLADIPGFGVDRLGQAFVYGGVALVEASVENELGIEIDYAAAVDEAGLAAFLGRAAPLTLTVPERLIARSDDGSGSVRFEAGEQVLDGPRLAEYWTFREPNEDELDAFPRQQLVLEALLAAARTDERLVDRLVGDGAPQLTTDADAAWLQQLFTALVGGGDGNLVFTLLPVEPFGGDAPDGSPSYRLRRDALQPLLHDLLAASLPERADADPLRVQVLNGVGVPGIGQEVDRRLEGGNFRIVLTDNARNFDFPTTRIVVYREDPDVLAAARSVRERLGVGTISVSRQPQSVVDVTIVVGADFLQLDTTGEQDR